jgi:hypothetical protein
MSSSAETAAAATRPLPQWVRDVRGPVPLPPPKSCDCQAHIFGDRKKYPPRTDPGYPLYDATFDDLVQWRKRRMMNDAEEVELLYRYVDNDRALLQQILVDNPARLHGF